MLQKLSKQKQYLLLVFWNIEKDELLIYLKKSWIFSNPVAFNIFILWTFDVDYIMILDIEENVNSGIPKTWYTIELLVYDWMETVLIGVRCNFSF